MNLIPLAIGLIAIVSACVYVVAEPEFQQIPVKVYQVRLLRGAASFGSNVDMSGKISIIGTSTVAVIEKGRLETVPPLHSYLVMKAGTETTYAVVFWQSYPNGTEYSYFGSLTVIVSSLQDNTVFTYSSDAASVTLGTY